MKKFIEWIKMLIEWVKAYNRWKYIVGGLLIGLCAFGWHCAAYTSVVAATCLEYKNWAYGRKWNWVNFALAIGASLLGYLIIFLAI